MSQFVIIADSSCDLNANLRERYGVAEYIPGILQHPDGRSENSDLDWNNISPEEFYGNMKGKKLLYKTGTPSLLTVKDCFEKYLKEGKDVLYIALSSGLSSTYHNAFKVAEELNEIYENKVAVVDSLRYAGGIAFNIAVANELRKEGKSFEEVVKTIEENKTSVHQMGSLDDLFFLKRMGRVSNAAAVMGTLISLKPLADFNEKGLSFVIGKAKGYKNALRATVEYVKKLAVNPEEQTMFISHSAREEQALILKDLLEKEVHPKALEILTVGQASGASIGPGLVTVFFKGNPLSKDLKTETETLASIIKK